LTLPLLPPLLLLPLQLPLPLLPLPLLQPPLLLLLQPPLLLLLQLPLPLPPQSRLKHRRSNSSERQEKRQSSDWRFFCSATGETCIAGCYVPSDFL